MRGQYLTSNNPELLSLYHLIDAPRDTKDGDFRAEHPYAAAALSVALMGAGAVLVFPAVLAAIGFTSGGVAAGLCLPHYFWKFPLLDID